MKIILSLLALAALSIACHESQSDKLADQIAADARAAVLNDYSNTLDAQAKQEQENDQQRSDAIVASDTAAVR